MGNYLIKRTNLKVLYKIGIVILGTYCDNEKNCEKGLSYSYLLFEGFKDQ